MITEIFLTMACLMSVVPASDSTNAHTTYTSQMFGDEKVFCNSINYEYPDDGYRDVELNYKIGVTSIDPIYAEPFTVYYSTVIQVFFPDFDTYDSTFTLTRTSGTITKISAGYILNKPDYSERDSFALSDGSLGFVDINSNNEFVIDTDAAVSAAKERNLDSFYLLLQVAYTAGYGDFQRKVNVIDSTDIDNDGSITDTIEKYNPKLEITTTSLPNSDYGAAKEYYVISQSYNDILIHLNCYMYAIINDVSSGMGVSNGQVLEPSNASYLFELPYSYCKDYLYSDYLFDTSIVPNLIKDLIYNKKRTARLLNSPNDKIYDFE